MDRKRRFVRNETMGLALLLWLTGMSQEAMAQTTVKTYVLEDVWLLPDVTHPGSAAQPMEGRFQWTYQEGAFESGVGQFTDLSLPWYNPALEELDFTFELHSIEITLRGSYHDLGVDVTLAFLEPLSPDRPSTIDTESSAFEIEQGISHKGHVVSGSVTPTMVGGTVQDISGLISLCRNDDTGQTVPVVLAGNNTWDCTAAGFTPGPGDAILQVILGEASCSGGVPDCQTAGEVFGVEGEVALCLNQTVPQLTVNPLLGGATWSCAEGGAWDPVEGDRILQIVTGTVAR